MTTLRAQTKRQRGGGRTNLALKFNKCRIASMASPCASFTTNDRFRNFSPPLSNVSAIAPMTQHSSSSTFKTPIFKLHAAFLLQLHR